jgi:hypothetical protein
VPSNKSKNRFFPCFSLLFCLGSNTLSQSKMSFYKTFYYYSICFITLFTLYLSF